MISLKIAVKTIAKSLAADCVHAPGHGFCLGDQLLPLVLQGRADLLPNGNRLGLRPLARSL